MRFLVVASCVAAFTTAPAVACPRNVLCVVKPDVTHAREVAGAARPAPVLQVRRLSLAPRDRLTFERPAKRDPGEVEMPWIWHALREQVHAQMPNHRTKSFTLTLSPVVVTTPSETVPGLGVAGDF